ncbi:uncharacterized protein LOC116143786 [Pistacia vera]|uniref:uncharacterized protein LOC116143786 n=1 Tax=Pistacia vera TaxID=55513 RepID=UPI0012637136|nr:uncharacterized protein LOC116143786 [Pistacia vera]
MVSTSLRPINGPLIFSSFRPLHRSASLHKWGLRRDQDASLTSSRTRSQEFLVLANPNVSKWGKSFIKEIIMVDPLEAKQLAAKQMEQIKVKEKFKRRRQIEAINGAWAMIGLTAGLVIEGHTGKNFLAQLAGYLSAIVSFFVH